MNNKEKEVLKSKILSRSELYELQGSRLKRIIKDPIRTIPYFIMQYFAYIHPYKVKYKTLWGDKMSFYLPEAGAIYYYGFFEANLSNFFINFFKEGDVFFDVGAHVGYYTMLATSLVGQDGHVCSFEPTPRTFESLKENIKNKKNVEAYNVAILDKDSEIEFFDYGPKYSAFNSFKKRTSDEIFFKDRATKIRVKTISLDSFCKDKNMSPTIIKIDAEGSEHLILKEMNYVLDNLYPLVTIEVSGGEEWKDNCVQSIDILVKKGYLCFEISLDGYLKTHIPKSVYSYDNLLFVHPEKLSRIKDLMK